jgi:hypothetical protein
MMPLNVFAIELTSFSVLRSPQSPIIPSPSLRGPG